jgi:hypothetical protein
MNKTMLPNHEILIAFFWSSTLTEERSDPTFSIECVVSKLTLTMLRWECDLILQAGGKRCGYSNQYEGESC